MPRRHVPRYAGYATRLTQWGERDTAPDGMQLVPLHETRGRHVHYYRITRADRYRAKHFCDPMAVQCTIILRAVLADLIKERQS